MVRFLKYLLATLIVVMLAAWVFWPREWVVRGPVLDFLTGGQIKPPAEVALGSHFTLPEGFSMGIFATVEHPRVMKFTAAGDMIVSSLRPGKIFLVRGDKDGDGRSDGQRLLLEGLQAPHGVALRDGYLYVAETGRVTRHAFDAIAGVITGPREIILDELPSDDGHRTRTIEFGPDGMLYLTVGSSCNVCIEKHPYRAAMLRMAPDGSDARLFATGLRNSVGFDWQPSTGRLYATDNGRDLLGDDTPNCELNMVDDGQDYGWPYAFDNRIADPDFGPDNPGKVSASTGMVHGFGGHRAPLGIRFLRPGLEPAGYEGAALVALHGSWNRSVLAGYKVVSLHFGADGSVRQQDFLSGFEKDGDVSGRPADVIQGPDGAIYVADDYAGSIYKIAAAGQVVANDTISERPKQNGLERIGATARVALQTEGAALFTAKGCAACHAILPGQAQPAARALKGLGSRFTLGGIRDLLTTPPATMPKIALSEDEKKALAVYLLSEYP